MPRPVSRLLPALLALWVLIAVLAPTGLAQQQPRQPRAPKQPDVPLVIVTKTDGTTVRGQFVSSDVDAVKIAPLGKKAGETLDPVSVPWAEINRVSNGMTYKKALAAWKIEHKDQLCTDCRGDRVVPCATCKGMGKDVNALPKDCPTCKGELLVECPDPKCEEGKVPCPATCLKLTQGVWKKKDDGLRWRTINGRRGQGLEISEGHLGELIVVNKEGAVENKGKCPTCGGATTIDCPKCQGRGKLLCPRCSALTDIAKCPTCEGKATQVCQTCKGTGLKTEGAPAGEQPAEQPAAPAAGEGQPSPG